MTQSTIQQLKSVLVLDDDMLQAKALGKKLEKGGFQVCSVTFTGLRAIEAVKKYQPNIALLDINLSGQPIDGIEVGKAIHAINKDTIIIYLTAYGSDENFQKALASNPHAFIEKPYQMKTIYRQIELAVQKVVQEVVAKQIPNENKTAPLGNSRILCFPNSLWLKNGTSGHQKIMVDDILYLKADGSSTDIVLKNSTIYPIMLLKEFDQELNYSNLLRVHNSYIVNLKNIQQVNLHSKGGKLTMDKGIEIPVSKSYISVFKTAWAQFLNTTSTS